MKKRLIFTAVLAGLIVVLSANVQAAPIAVGDKIGIDYNADLETQVNESNFNIINAANGNQTIAAGNVINTNGTVMDGVSIVTSDGKFANFAGNIDPGVLNGNGGSAPAEFTVASATDFAGSFGVTDPYVTTISGLDTSLIYDVAGLVALDDLSSGRDITLEVVGASTRSQTLSWPYGQWEQLDQYYLIRAVAPDGTGTITLNVTASNNNPIWNGVLLTAVQEEITVTGTPTVTEGSSGDTFDIVLISAPSGPVTVVLNSDSQQVSLSDEFLSFTTGNWATPQTVTVNAVDDKVIEDNPHTSEIELIASGGGTTGYPAFVTVTIQDNDTLPPLLGSFVNSDPNNTECADGMNGEGECFTNSTATDGLWRYRDEKPDTASFNYWYEGDVLEQNNQTLNEVTDSRLAVTTIDGLTPGTEYEIRAVFWARLLSEYNALAGLSENDLLLLCPEYYFETVYTGDFTRVKSDIVATGVVGDPDRLYEVQPLIGTAVADGNGEIKAYFSGFFPEDNPQNGANFQDQRTWFEGFRYQVAKLDVVESDGGTFVTDTTSDTFTVALASAPSADVTVDVYEIGSSSALGDVTPAALTFTTGNWSTPQTVTVNGKQPPENVDYYNSTVVLEASSTDGYYDGFFTTVYVQDVDCGIYDYHPLDFDLDCDVDLSDYAAFAKQWMECTDPSDGSCEDGRPWNDPWNL